MPEDKEIVYAKALLEFVKAKNRTLGEGSLEFVDAELYLYDPKSLAIRLQELHFAAVGDLPVEYLRIPIRSAKAAKILFARTFMCAAIHVSISSQDVVDSWLTDFSQTMRELGASGGLESLYLSMLAHASDEAIDQSLDIWNDLVVDGRNDGGFEKSIALDQGAKSYLEFKGEDFLRAFEEAKIAGNTTMGIKQYLDERRGANTDGRGQWETADCVNLLRSIGAFMGARKGGATGAAKGYQAGEIVGNMACPAVRQATDALRDGIGGAKDDTGPEIPTDKPDYPGGVDDPAENNVPRDPTDDDEIACGINPRNIVERDPFSAFAKSKLITALPFGTAMSNFGLKNIERVGEAILETQEFIAARIDLLNARADLQRQSNLVKGGLSIGPGFGGLGDEGIGVKVKVDGFDGELSNQQLEQIYDAVTKLRKSDQYTISEEMSGEVLTGYSVTFPPGSAGYALHPNGLNLPPWVKDPKLLMKLVASVSGWNEIDPAAPIKVNNEGFKVALKNYQIAQNHFG